MLYFTHGAVRSKWLHCWGNVVEKFSLAKSPPPPPRCVFRTADLQTNKWGQFPELFTLMISNNGPPPAPCKIWCLDVQYNMNNNIQFRTIFRTIHDNLYVWVSGREVSSHCRVERTINTAGVSWSAPVYSCSESLITTPASCNQSPPGAVKHDG